MTTIESLFPGKMGRVMLTRVAIRMRRPELLKMNKTEVLAEELADKVREALAMVKKG